MSKIKIHQALYGEANRAHSKIYQTIDDSELTSFLIQFTDRPGSLTPGVKLKPYLSGSAFGNYYVFTKTFSDHHASRAGMVITHVLILELKFIEEVNDLYDILNLLMSEVPEVRDNLDPMDIIVEHSAHINEKVQPIYIQKVLSSFIKAQLPVLFTGDLDSFKAILQKLWNSPIRAMREQLKYRASFSPQDINDSNDLTIVLIQSELLPKWKTHSIISDEDKESVEITSHSEALFLGHIKENPFQSFLNNLEIKLANLKMARQCDQLYSNFSKLNELSNPDILRNDIRLLAEISPNKNNGKTIKQKFIEKYKKLVQDGLELNVKGLRNIQFSSFEKGEEIGKTLVKAIIEKAIIDSQFKHIQMLAEVAAISVNETNKNWWHQSVIDTYKLNSSNAIGVIQKSFWKLLLFSKDSSKDILSLIPTNKDSESLLRKYLPIKIPIEIGQDILLALQKRTWYLLHAEVLLKLCKPSVAIKKQLAVEHSLNFEESIGVKLLLNEFGDDKLLTITLDSCNEKLTKELTFRILKNEALLKSIDLSISCWLNIWTSVLIENQEFNFGIRNREKEIVSSILDVAVQDKKINDIIFDLISDTEYSNIADFKPRNEVWQYIPISSRNKFIKATAESVLKKLLKDEIDYSSIEQSLTDYITSKPFIISFLNTNKNNIEPILKVFENFSGLPDSFFSDYIFHYSSQITENQSQRLGTIIQERNFTASAKNVYDKSRYYSSFSLAYEVCKSLVKISWWESLRSSPIQSSKSRDHLMEQPNKNVLNSIQSLPTIVILTAIQDEYEAVKLFLKEVVEVDQDDTTYEAGIFELHEKDIAKVIIRECGAKNTIAAQETERAIRNFKPSAIFFVGIAGSRKPKDFSLGDVVFPEKIYSYEGGKSEKSMFSSRPDLGGTSYTLSEIAKKERRKNDWKTLIKNGWQNEVKADLGVIASGEKLVEHYESEVGKILTKHYNDTSAVEMEGFGFAKAATRQGRSNSQMMIGVVRGISDIIEQPNKKNKEEVTDRRPDNARQLASDTAAAFAFWLIFKAFS